MSKWRKVYHEGFGYSINDDVGVIDKYFAEHHADSIIDAHNAVLGNQDVPYISDSRIVVLYPSSRASQDVHEAISFHHDGTNFAIEIFDKDKIWVSVPHSYIEYLKEEAIRERIANDSQSTTD